MLRFIVAPAAILVAGGLLTAPASAPPDVKALVAGLSDPDSQVRRASADALKERADALPWLRRANRSKDERTAQRADALIAPHRANRQRAVPKALDACVREGRVDLFTEWHQWWEPALEEELWESGPKIAKAGLDLYAKSCPPADWAEAEKWRGRIAAMPTAAHNGPCPDQRLRLPRPRDAAWALRTDRIGEGAIINDRVRFASVGGSVALPEAGPGVVLLALGPIRTTLFGAAFAACDGSVWPPPNTTDASRLRKLIAGQSVVVCRGHFGPALDVRASVVLVEGDIDLSQSRLIENSLIRAGGEVHLRTDVKIINSTVEGRATRPTAPYSFFELADVGLSVADDEEGLMVSEVQPGMPFGECGLAKGDLIRAIDDAPAGHSEQFRKAARRALVRQGDCLLTVTRGDRTIDLPVFFPLPK